jgi:hypothetical protein
MKERKKMRKNRLVKSRKREARKSSEGRAGSPRDILVESAAFVIADQHIVEGVRGRLGELVQERRDVSQGALSLRGAEIVEGRNDA